MWKSWREDKPKLDAMRANNEKLEYIAFKLNRNLGSVATKVCRELETRDYKPWTNEEFEVAKLLYALGVSYRNIGEFLNRSRGSIQSKFQEDRKKAI